MGDSCDGRLNQPGDQAEYEYDFGDGWLHTIKLVSIDPRKKGARYPLCIAGERACTPEDCGGIRGYHELLKAGNLQGIFSLFRTLPGFLPALPSWFD
jgi:hypothetical protein